MRSRSVLLLILIAFISCSEPYFQADKEFEQEVWTYDDPFSLAFSAKDTQQLYNFLLEIEHKKSYSYQNIYFRVQTVFPDGDTIQDPFSVNLANKFGYWNGDCRGEDCTLTVPIQQNVKFKQIGEHSIQFSQYSRQDSLSGIKELAFRIEEVEK